MEAREEEGAEERREGGWGDKREGKREGWREREEGRKERRVCLSS